MRVLIIPAYSGSCFRRPIPNIWKQGSYPMRHRYKERAIRMTPCGYEVVGWCTEGSTRVHGVVESISVDSGRRAAATGRVRKEREEQHSLYSSGGSSVLPDRCNEASRPQSVAIVRPAAVRAYKSGSTFLLGLLSGLRTEFLFTGERWIREMPIFSVTSKGRPE